MPNHNNNQNKVSHSSLNQVNHKKKNQVNHSRKNKKNKNRLNKYKNKKNKYKNSLNKDNNSPVRNKKMIMSPNPFNTEKNLKEKPNRKSRHKHRPYHQKNLDSTSTSMKSSKTFQGNKCPLQLKNQKLEQ